MWSNFPHSPCWQSLFGQVRTTKLPRDEQIVSCGDKLRTESLPLCLQGDSLVSIRACHPVLYCTSLLPIDEPAPKSAVVMHINRHLLVSFCPSDVLQLHHGGLVHRLSGRTFSSFPEIHSPRMLGVDFCLAWKSMRRLSLGEPRATSLFKDEAPSVSVGLLCPLHTTFWRGKRFPGLRVHRPSTPKITSQEFNGS